MSSLFRDRRVVAAVAATVLAGAVAAVMLLKGGAEEEVEEHIEEDAEDSFSEEEDDDDKLASPATAAAAGAASGSGQAAAKPPVGALRFTCSYCRVMVGSNSRHPLCPWCGGLAVGSPVLVRFGSPCGRFFRRELALPSWYCYWLHELQLCVQWGGARCILVGGGWLPPPPLRPLDNA